MFKASTFFCLRYTKIVSRHAGNLVSDPKKLKGMVGVSSNTEFLHKDAIVSVQPKLRNSNDFGYEYYGQIFFNNRFGTEDSECLHSLREYFLTQFGVQEFKEFLERNELLKDTLLKKEQYKSYFSEIALKFNYDRNLLKLVSDCNIHELVVSNFSEIFNGKENSQEDIYVGKFWTQKAIGSNENYVFNYFPLEDADHFDNDSDKKEFKMFSISNEYPQVIEEERTEEPEEAKESTDKSAIVFDLDEESSEDTISYTNDKEMPHDPLSEMKSQIPIDIFEFFIKNKVIVFSQEKSSKNPVTNWVYVQLETGNDDLLTIETVERAMKSCGVRSTKRIEIFNGTNKRKQKIVESEVMNKIKASNRNIVLGQKPELFPAKILPKQEIPKEQAKIKIFQSPKAYAFIELNEISDKMKVLNPHFRIFGVNMFGSLLLVDDADIKFTIVVRNVDITDQDMFEAKFNEELLNNKSDVQIRGYQIYNYFNGKMNQILLRLKTFEDAFEVANIMNNKTLRGKKITVDFRRGCGIWDSGEYRETLNGFIGSDSIEGGKKDKKKH
ncbi:unnamed protein product [Blepharisma stoltei]|uniref:RRM domain-containing protein n=1 Tax=Blepharisma stoltei TaxID=1481888 RepID=A0AAU9JSS5_9CILI|nr:unnamed protein product [Blepharisma stoltei]